jgi:hypothetical protein
MAIAEEANIALNASFALNAAAIVPCVLTTVPILSPGISSVVSTNAMVLIINLVRSPETSAYLTAQCPIPDDLAFVARRRKQPSPLLIG